MRRERQVFFGAVGLALALGLNIWIARTRPDISPLEPTSVADSVPTEVDAESPPVAHKQLQMVHAQSRPIFLPGRKPWFPPNVQLPVVEPPPLPQPTSELQQAPPGELNAVLVGFQRDQNGSRALLVLAAGDVRWVAAGQKVGDWLVEKIDASSVEFSAGGQMQTLELFPSALPTTPVVGPP